MATTDIANGIAVGCLFAGPPVALLWLAKTSGRRTPLQSARAASLATAVLAFVIIAAFVFPGDLGDLGRPGALSLLLVALVPGLPWVLLEREPPGELPLVFSMIISGALAAIFGVAGLIATFAGMIAESGIGHGGGPGALFLLVPTALLIALQLRVMRPVLRAMRGTPSVAPTPGGLPSASPPVAAGPLAEPKLRLTFEHCGEIRMGSPYQRCTLRLDGEWVPELERTDWVRVSAMSPDRRFVGLARWDTPANTPGFRVITIDCVGREVATSDRFEGCCQALSWTDKGFVPMVWRPPRQ